MHDGMACGPERRAPEPGRVPDQQGNAGYSQSFTDILVYRLTCARAGRPAAQTDLLSNRSWCGVKSPLIIAGGYVEPGYQQMGVAPEERMTAVSFGRSRPAGRADDRLNLKTLPG
jgi:hypothetical protein